MIGWVRFNSSKFKAEPDEELEINPGKCGRRLAAWLSGELSARGFRVERMYPEDWGYEIALQADHHSKYVGCQNDGDQVAAWACSIEVKQGMLSGLISKVDVQEEFAKLRRAVKEILSEEAQIRDITWES